MATAKHAISEHDVVVLREPVGGWPVGTSGTVVSVYDGAVLVEIIGPGGKTLEMVQARPAQLDIKTPNPERQRAALHESSPSHSD